MNITLYFFDKKKIALIATPLIAILILGLALLFYEKIDQAKMAKGYLMELQKIDNLEGDKKIEYIENIFNTSQNSLYKVYFGVRIVNEIHQKNPDKAISIAKQILSIRNLPDYISDAILTKLSYIYLNQLSDIKNNAEKFNEIEEYLLSNKSKETVFYPIRHEAYLEILLLNGKVNEYYNGIIELQKNKNLPERMMARLAGMQHDIEFLKSNN